MGHMASASGSEIVKTSAPFIRPRKCHEEYYHPLLLASERIQNQCQFLVPLLLEFVCGELDFSTEFFQSTHWKRVKSALDDNTIPFFNLTTTNDEARIEVRTSSKDIKEDNTMTIEECKAIVSEFSPKCTEKDTSIFWKDFETEYFESIWFYLNDGTVMNGGDYGEYESYWRVVGILNPEK